MTEIQRLDLPTELAKQPAPPEYVVHELVERGALHLLSGDTGAGKSLLAASMSASVAGGRPWLGRSTTPTRILYLDGEQQARRAVERIRGFGVRADDQTTTGNLHYVRMPGLSLMLEADQSAIRRYLHDHAIDMLVVDTIVALTPGLDVNSHQAAGELFGRVIRPLAGARDGMTVVLVHHERKSQPGVSRDASQAVLGARTWVSQVDHHIAVRKDHEAGVVRAEGPDGQHSRTWRTRYALPKMRDLAEDAAHESAVEIRSTYSRDGALISTRIEPAGDVVTANVSRHRELRSKITGVLEGQLVCRGGAVAERVGSDSQDRSYKRALASLVEDGFVASSKTDSTLNQGEYKWIGGVSDV